MIRLIARALVFAVLAVSSYAVVAEGDHMAVYKTKGTFADVKEAVVQALTGRGFVINNISHIGNMLERTGKDLGSGKKVFVEAEALEFCSATVSRKMMETDPDNIVFCPYIISIYVVPSKPDEVRVAYRKTQMVGGKESQAALKAVNDLLTEIITEAVQ